MNYNITFGVVAFIIWACVFTFYKLKRGSKQRRNAINAFIEDEREANSARKHEIEGEFFFVPDLAAIPLLNDGSAQEEKVINFSKRTMISFPERVSNTELKKLYGPSQLESITQYEENYSDYLAALIALAERRIETGNSEEALVILEHTLALKSDYRKSYQLTAELYAAKNEKDKLEALLALAEERAFADEGLKRWAVKMIKDKQKAIKKSAEGKP